MWSPGFCAESVQGNHNQAGLVFVVVVSGPLLVVSIGASPGLLLVSHGQCTCYVTYPIPTFGLERTVCGGLEWE